MVLRVPAVQLAPNMTATVTLEAQGAPAPGLGAGSFRLDYDPSVVTVTACQPDPGGHFESELCNFSAPGVVRFNLIALNGVQDAFPLAGVAVKAVGAAGTRTDLDLTVTTVAGPDGEAMAATVQDGEVRIGGASWFPLVQRAHPRSQHTTDFGANR